MQTYLFDFNIGALQRSDFGSMSRTSDFCAPSSPYQTLSHPLLPVVLARSVSRAPQHRGFQATKPQSHGRPREP
jgi:hypothetical protein